MDRQQWNERYAAKPLLWAVDPSPFLRGELGDRPAGRALDLGAGEGRTTLWLAERGWKVTAVDFSDVAIDRGRQRLEAAGLPGAVEWICADLVEFDPTGGSYDLILLLFIHLPAPDRRRLLRLAAATLAPGGMVLVVGYDTTHVGQEGGPQDPSVRFGPEDIVTDLEGMRIERAERLAVGDAIDAVVRAVRD
ncbi:MAG: Thioredoxin reductase [uncultured Acidimicrobiales bacterium]|uniref:Thioredoxin reductase n=1 Tax=uncultured Acidimicrobiales bacterium TaxID=310071 RepID=A0A6J4IS22_9ACTN|nr:MAG: Thioredoxin reductase [uncultured Acidimicrobiales bacterium]